VTLWKVRSDTWTKDKTSLVKLVIQNRKYVTLPSPRTASSGNAGCVNWHFSISSWSLMLKVLLVFIINGWKSNQRWLNSWLILGPWHTLQKRASEIGAIRLNSKRFCASFSCRCTTSNVIDCLRGSKAVNDASRALAQKWCGIWRRIYGADFWSRFLSGRCNCFIVFCVTYCLFCL